MAVPICKSCVRLGFTVAVVRFSGGSFNPQPANSLHFYIFKVTSISRFYSKPSQTTNLSLSHSRGKLRSYVKVQVKKLNTSSSCLL